MFSTLLAEIKGKDRISSFRPSGVLEFVYELCWWFHADCNLRQGARHLKGTYKGNCFTYFFGFFGPIWALMGPYGPGPGPWRAGKVQKMHLFLSKSFFKEIVVFDLQTPIFDGKTVFFRFLAEIRMRTLAKSSQKASSGPISCKFRTTCTLPGRVRTLPQVTVWESGAIGGLTKR